MSVRSIYISFSQPDTYIRSSLAQSITPTILEEENMAISSIPSEAKIKHAAFSIHPDKALGSDGYNALFFQCFWNLVGGDVVNMVHNFFFF